MVRKDPDNAHRGRFLNFSVHLYAWLVCAIVYEYVVCAIATSYHYSAIIRTSRSQSIRAHNHIRITRSNGRVRERGRTQQIITNSVSWVRDDETYSRLRSSEVNFSLILASLDRVDKSTEWKRQKEETRQCNAELRMQVQETGVR